jgi:hypothetical protein
MNKKLVKQSLLHVVLAIAYIFCVATFFRNAEFLLGKEDNFFSPVIALMLLVMSAAIMGILFFGRPVQLYLDNQKKEALSFLGYTISWFALVFIVFILILIIFKFFNF